MVERRLQASGKPFVAGTDKPTIADIKAIMMFRILVLNPKTIMAPEYVNQIKSKLEKMPIANKYVDRKSVV